MNFRRIVGSAGALAALGVWLGGAMADDTIDREAIAERLAPVGQLCLQGQECITEEADPIVKEGSAAVEEDSAVASIDGAAIYNRSCMACHETGAANAPVRNDEAGWRDRTEQGFAILLEHSINGIGAMPARGGNPNLTDQEVEAATVYLVEPVMDLSEQEEESTEDGEAEKPVNQTAPDNVETVTDDNDLDGEALYSRIGCVTCHATGIAGAPALGDADAWAPHNELTRDTLYQSVFNGKGAMPPRGGSNASDAEIRAAVDYMVEAQ